MVKERTPSFSVIESTEGTQSERVTSANIAHTSSMGNASGPSVLIVFMKDPRALERRCLRGQ